MKKQKMKKLKLTKIQNMTPNKDNKQLSYDMQEYQNAKSYFKRYYENLFK